VSATRAMLAGGVVAGPLYVVVGLAQAFTRPGFDLRRHELSLLSNGDLGWIQIANFLVTGLLTIACAVGMRRALTGRGRTWGPLLVGLYGLGLIGAGLFVADPMSGFPPGTPAGTPSAVSGHSLMHIVSGSVGFLGLIAACFVFARRWAALGQRGWAACSAATGLLFFAAFAGIASGSREVWINEAFGVAVVIAWAWLTATAARLMTARA
jgi:hypothetical membrane protein